MTMRMLDAEEKRVLRLMAHVVCTGQEFEGSEADAVAAFRLAERRCVRISVSRWTNRADCQLTELGKIAARLP